MKETLYESCCLCHWHFKCHLFQGCVFAIFQQMQLCTKRQHNYSWVFLGSQVRMSTCTISNHVHKRSIQVMWTAGISEGHVMFHVFHIWTRCAGICAWTADAPCSVPGEVAILIACEIVLHSPLQITALAEAALPVWHLEAGADIFASANTLC